MPKLCAAACSQSDFVEEGARMTSHPATLALEALLRRLPHEKTKVMTQRAPFASSQENLVVPSSTE